MKPTIILRIASILALLQYSAHSFLFLSATPTHGPDEIAAIDAMKSHHFIFNGFNRSYWDFYFGYGLLAILSGLIEVVLLWQVATLAKVASHYRIRPIIALFIFANVSHALLTLKYFFLAPVIFDVVIAMCLVFAFIAARRKDA